MNLPLTDTHIGSKYVTKVQRVFFCFIIFRATRNGGGSFVAFLLLLGLFFRYPEHSNSHIGTFGDINTSAVA